MKTFIKTLLLSLLAAFLVNRLAFDGVLDPRIISDSFFFVGIFMFFIGLIIVTGAGSIFQGVSYTWKYIFKRSELKGLSFHEYNESEQKLPTQIGNSVFGVGVIFILISLLVPLMN